MDARKKEILSILKKADLIHEKDLINELLKIHSLTDPEQIKRKIDKMISENQKYKRGIMKF
ncbi:hypothetical protein [Tenacibaculum sp. 190524A02b]|uniref:Uncharacterized protein n=1 Tax=Tenacibaculum vairaonense TaxID=3137860 RepID=A0ABP1F800_9FLAO